MAVRSVTSYGALEEKNTVPIDIRYYEDRGRQTLEEIIFRWSEEDQGHYLMAAQNAIVLQIGRCLKKDGEWIKHHMPLELGNTVIIPASSDGIHVYKDAFKVAGVILHLGEDQMSGHFVTVQYYHDVMWLMDDDVPPKPISQLSEQQKGEVFQVWLVREGLHNPSPVLSPRIFFGTITFEKAKAVQGYKNGHVQCHELWQGSGKVGNEP